MQNFNVKGIDRVKIAYPGFYDRLGLIKKGKRFQLVCLNNKMKTPYLMLWVCICELFGVYPIVSCFTQSNIVSSPQNCVFSTGRRLIFILWCCVSFTDQKVWLLGCISQTQTNFNSHTNALHFVYVKQNVPFGCFFPKDSYVLLDFH